MRLPFLLSAAALSLGACGGDGPAGGPDATVDATVDSAMPLADASPDAGPADSGADAGAVEPLSKGPWVLRAGTDHATVVWETRVEPVSVTLSIVEADGGTPRTVEGSSRETVLSHDYGAGPPLVHDPDLAGTYWLNEVPVSGLAPATCYRYTLVDFPERGGRLCTMHEATDHATPITIYVIGDTNPILEATGRLFEAVPPTRGEFVVHAGDLQYYESLLESWQVWFGLMRPMLEAGGIFPCPGNHEDELDGELEEFYGRLFTPASDDGDATRYHFQTGGVHVFSLDSQSDLGAGSAQLEWFEEGLTAAEATEGYRFSILLMHRPIYSVGDYTPNLAVRAALEPIITAHEIPLVIAGHMHGYERFEVGPVTHITAGGGGGLIGNVDERVDVAPEEAALRVASGPFFEVMVLTIEDGRLVGVVTDDEGVERDRFEKTVP